MSEPAPNRRSGLRRLSTDYDGQGPTLAPGTFVANRYRIVRRLGTGGMGAVYEAEQVAIGRRVALKVLRPELAADESLAERFRREARAASLIRSPHVVVVHDFGGGDEHAPLFLVMELLAGESLEARLAREHVIEPRAAVAIAREIAQALAAAHAAGVVHRDLKPANVVVAPDQALKVVDFGIARVLESAHEPGGTKMTQAGTLLGTPAYMSPEACLRRPVGPAADLYALGIILFEMLTGKLPLEDEEPILLLGLHARVPPPRLRDERPDLLVPDALEDLVDRLLAKKPEDRPRDAVDVIAQLDALDWTQLAASRAPGPAQQTAVVAGATRSHRRLLALPLGAALVALAVVGGAIAYSARDDGTAVPVVEPTAVAPPPPPRPAVAPPAVPPRVATAQPIRLTIDVTPRDATLTVDGAPASPGILEVPADGRVLEILASAPGHQDRTTTVRADQDRHVSIELPRAPRVGRAKRAVQVRRRTTAATTSPTGQTPPPTGRAGRLSDWD